MSRVPKENRQQLIELGMERAIYALTKRRLRTMNRIFQAYRNEVRSEDVPHRRRPRGTMVGDDEMLVAVVAIDPFQSASEVRESL